MLILIYLNWNNAVNNKYTKKYYLPKCIMENFNVCFNNFLNEPHVSVKVL